MNGGILHCFWIHWIVCLVQLPLYILKCFDFRDSSLFFFCTAPSTPLEGAGEHVDLLDGPGHPAGRGRRRGGRGRRGGWGDGELPPGHAAGAFFCLAWSGVARSEEAWRKLG